MFALALVPVGLTALTALTTANAMVQLASTPEMRGRVMALYMAIFMGGTPLGAPLIGWIGERSGPLDDRHRHRRRGPVARGRSRIPLPATECPSALRVPPPAEVHGDHRAARHPGARSRPVNVRFRQRLTIAALVLLVALVVIAALVRR